MILRVVFVGIHIEGSLSSEWHDVQLAKIHEIIMYMDINKRIVFVNNVSSQKRFLSDYSFSRQICIFYGIAVLSIERRLKCLLMVLQVSPLAPYLDSNKF